MHAHIAPVGSEFCLVASWMPKLSASALDAQVARLRQLNRSEADLARAIRDMVKTSNNDSLRRVRSGTSCAMAEQSRSSAVAVQPRTHDRDT